jgi:large subunit ribosomal protein L15
MNLSNLKPRPGSKHRVKRLGSGESSGHGKTCGKGHKGQKARSGGSIRLGFEGGQMPLIRRIPKRGFNNAVFKKVWAIVNLDALNHFDAGSTVDQKVLLDAGAIKRPFEGVKVLGSGELTKKLSVVVNHASASAKAAIEKAGGTLTIQ